MVNTPNYVADFAIFLAGIATATIAARRRTRSDREAISDLRRTVAQLESRLQAGESAVEQRLSHVDSVLDEHTAKLSDVPSTSQVASAMEQLLSKTMSSLDERLTNQANAMEILKATFSQTDGLLERVLESLEAGKAM